MRGFRVLTIALLSLTVSISAAQAQAGNPDSKFEAIDRYAKDLIAEFNLPSVSVAIMKDGQLIYTRAFGYANPDARVAATASTRYRIASLSKPITALGILSLVDAQKLTLDDRLVDILPELFPSTSQRDPRLNAVTIRHLLQHTAGWDRDVSGDVMFTLARSDDGSLRFPEQIARVALTRKLDFTPGERYAYSNFGYSLLGRVIERRTGMSYEPYMRSVLARAGVTRMAIGHTPIADAMRDEAYYVDKAAAQPSLWPPHAQTPLPYGSFNLEALDAHGGWIASASDLMRFITLFDGQDSIPDLLSQDSIGSITTRPTAKTWESSAAYYGLGWMARPYLNGFNLWHTGSLPGTTTLLVKAATGLSWAVLTNTRLNGPQQDALSARMDGGMWNALSKVDFSGARDLFPEMP